MYPTTLEECALNRNIIIQVHNVMLSTIELIVHMPFSPLSLTIISTQHSLFFSTKMNYKFKINLHKLH